MDLPNRKGLFSSARARYHSLLASAIKAAFVEASPWCPAAIWSILAGYIGRRLTNDEFAANALGIVRGPRDLAADIFFVRPGTIGAHINHNWLRNECVKEGSISSLDDIDWFAADVCSGYVEDCELSSSPYSTKTSRIKARTIDFTDHLNAKFTAYEKAPMFVP